MKVSNTTPISMTGINIQSARRCFRAGKDAFTPSMPEVMDSAIDTFINKTGKMNVAAGIRFHKILNKYLPEIMTPENYINCGSHAKVYRISDNYVARVRIGHSAQDVLGMFDWTRVPGRKFGEIDMYCGEPLIQCRNVEILRNAAPTGKSMPCGISYGIERTTEREKGLEKYYNEYLPICSDLPQSSYDEFALNLKKINEIKDKDIMYKEVSYTLDVFNPNNVIISDGKFKLVDSLERIPVEEPNTLYTMLEPLLTNVQVGTYAEYHEPATDMRVNILRKSLIAAEKANLPFDNELKGTYSDYVLNDILRSSDFNVAKGELKYFRKHNVPLSARIDYINSVFGGNKHD